MEDNRDKDKEFQCPFCGDEPCLKPHCVYTPPEEGGLRWIGDKAA